MLVKLLKASKAGMKTVTAPTAVGSMRLQEVSEDPTAVICSKVLLASFGRPHLLIRLIKSGGGTFTMADLRVAINKI